MKSDLYFERISAASIELSETYFEKRLNSKTLFKACKTKGTKNGKHFEAIEFESIPSKQELYSKKVYNFFFERIKELMYSQYVIPEKILVAGIGNPYLTVDSFGSAVIDKIKSSDKIMTFKPLTSGITGIDSYSVLKGLILTAKPDILIAIDTLKTGSVEKIGKSIQLTDDGIQAGSGVGKVNKKLSEESLGIPVIALGVPLLSAYKVDFGCYGEGVTCAKCDALIQTFSCFLGEILTKIF